MFRVEVSTAYDGGVIRHLQELDLPAILLANELAVWLEAQLRIPLLIRYTTTREHENLGAECRLEFPDLDRFTYAFLVFKFNPESEDTVPTQWSPEMDKSQFFELMRKKAAELIDKTLIHKRKQIEARIAIVERILKPAEEPVDA